MKVTPPALLTMLLVVTNSAYANDKTALTFSPLHLFSPVLEVTLESPVSPGISVAGILGYGSVTIEDNTDKVKFGLFEAGGQVRYYPGTDSSSGFHIGLEAMYIKPIFDDVKDVTVSVNGFAIGPMLGYKWAYNSGMIFDLQLGYQWLFGQAKAKNSAGDEIESSVDDSVTLLNLNLGFAF